jgi:hypothetical protein
MYQLEYSWRLLSIACEDNPRLIFSEYFQQKNKVLFYSRCRLFKLTYCAARLAILHVDECREDDMELNEISFV